ncbi:hypothetical protein OJAV_G00234200 [Oryzias javanicus]|uniref:Uncharacterized protein n=1 Tax=Oryzias javanicus TaxID=123683 RepID=A0A3S2PMD7_ORYJA|nr:hypothetical protein OJAV_G00234200 [Oryzias javanicus]
MENQNEDEEFADEEQESEVHHETNILNRNEQDEAGHSVHEVNSQVSVLFLNELPRMGRLLCTFFWENFGHV